MTLPRTLLGSASDGRIMLLGETHQDIGTALNAKLVTNPCAPEGAAVDYDFARVYITLTHDSQVHLRCTPLVDQKKVRSGTITVAGETVSSGVFDIEIPQPPERRSYVHEQILSEKSEYDEALEGLRGRWFQLEIESVGGVFPGDLILDQIVLEYEVLSPTDRDT